MKKFLLAALAVIALAFTSCTWEWNSVANYEGGDALTTYHFSFKVDGTYTIEPSGLFTGFGVAYKETGTYAGIPTSDGTVKLTAKTYYDKNFPTPVEETITITNGKFDKKFYWNENGGSSTTYEFTKKD